MYKSIKGPKSYLKAVKKAHHNWYGTTLPRVLQLDGIGDTKVFIGEHEKSPRFHIIDPNTHKYITTISLLKPEYIGTKSLRLNDRQKEQLVEWLSNFGEPGPIGGINFLYSEWYCYYTEDPPLYHPGPIPDYSLLK